MELPLVAAAAIAIGRFYGLVARTFAWNPGRHERVQAALVAARARNEANLIARNNE